jgi:hypothetical protein
VPELNGWHGAVLRDEAGDPGETWNMLVAPYAEIARADATTGFDRGGFHHHETRSSNGASAEVDEVPVAGETIFGGILTHG